MVKPEDLDGEARRLYESWRSLGLSESTAMESLQRDGWIPTTDHDRLVRTFRQLFGLSEAAAEIAADGRVGSSPEATRAAQVHVSESNLEWHARMQREVADLDRSIAEVDGMQRELYPKLIMEDIARAQAEERRRLRGD